MYSHRTLQFVSRTFGFSTAIHPVWYRDSAAMFCLIAVPRCLYPTTSYDTGTAQYRDVPHPLRARVHAMQATYMRIHGKRTGVQMGILRYCAVLRYQNRPNAFERGSPSMWNRQQRHAPQWHMLPLELFVVKTTKNDS